MPLTRRLMRFRLGGGRCLIPLLIWLVNGLQLGAGLKTQRHQRASPSPALSDFRDFDFQLRCWSCHRPLPLRRRHRLTLDATLGLWWPRPHRPLRAKHPPKLTLDDKLVRWWPELTFQRTPRRVILLRSPEHTNATWILIPWTKDRWPKVRALKDSVLGSDTKAQSRPDLPPSKPHMCVICLCHGRILCRFALHWCDPPPCLTGAGSSLLTPAVWPQVCLQPRQLHARPAVFPPAGAQGLPHCPLLLWFKPQVHLAGMHPALCRLSSPVLIPVRFRARESYSDVQCLACASRSVPLKWVLGGRPVASQGLLGFHKSPPLGTVSAPLSSIMAPRPRTVFTEHLRETSSSPVPSSGLGRRSRRSVREAEVDLTADSDAGRPVPSGVGRGTGAAFLEADLRMERAPDEFLAVAASLGREYAQGLSTTRPLDTTSHGPIPSRAKRRRARSSRSHERSGEKRSGERTWPAGATPGGRGLGPMHPESLWRAETGTGDSVVQVSEGSDEDEVILMEETAATAPVRLPPKPKPMPRPLRASAETSSSCTSTQRGSEADSTLGVLVSAVEEADVALCSSRPPPVSWPSLDDLDKVPSAEMMTSQPAGRLGADSSETPNPVTPQFARADLIHQAALLNQSGHNALSGALGDGDGTPPQVFIMSPELDSILHMYDYTGFARRAPIRAHTGVHLWFPLSSSPRTPFMGFLLAPTSSPVQHLHSLSLEGDHSACRTARAAALCSPLGACPWCRYARLCWHVPTLLRNRSFQHHPWVQCARRCHRKGRTAKSVHPYGWRREGDVSHSRLCTCRSFLNPSTLWYALQTGLWSGSPRRRGAGSWSGPCWQSIKLGHTLFCISMQCLCGLTALGMHRLAMRTPHTHTPPTLASNSPSHICGPPGPKSGECPSYGHPLRGSKLCLLLLLSRPMLTAGTLDARVAALAQGAAEAAPVESVLTSQAAAKQLLGKQATQESQPQSFSKIQKRSYARALRRAAERGGAWYRGRWIKQDPAARSMLTSATPTRRTARRPGRPSPGPVSRHYDLLTWNVGGLGGGLYDELLLYIKQSSHDIIIVQETKWRFESTWEDEQHYFIHTGSQAKDHCHAGVLTVIARRIVDPGSLRFIAPIAGRLLRVQFKHGPRQIDVINVYQHTWRNTKHVTALRSKLWDALTKQVHEVPLRSRLLIGGDFNTPCLQAVAPAVGLSVLTKPDHGILDSDDFGCLIQGLDLVVLNTYQQEVPCHTYQWDKQKSQIDFWLVRRLHSGGAAKRAKPLHNFILGRWRGGPRHLPVSAQVMYHWQPWEHHRMQHGSREIAVDRHAIQIALSTEGDNKVALFRTQVHQLLESADSNARRAEDLQAGIYNIACRIFPKHPPQRVSKPWQDGAMTHYAHTMWSHFRSRAAIVRQCGRRLSLHVAFKIWKHTMYFNRLHRAALARGKALRKKRREDLLDQARKAALERDYREHHRLINLKASA